MLSLVLGLAVLPITFGIWSLVSLFSQLARARSTGLPCVIVPCSCLGAPWLLSQPILLPIFQLLPTSWTQNWLPLLRFERGWHDGYEPFAKVGADTFLTVSPGDIVLYTCDPDVSSQLLHDQRFGKPAHLMGVLNIFGPTIAGTDGPESRFYRRIAAPFFTQQTIQRVFTLSVAGGKQLGKALCRPSAYRQLRTLTARLSLNLLSQICFDNQGQDDLAKALQFQEDRPNRHILSYSQAMHSLLDNYKTIFISPRWLLPGWSPVRTHRLAGTAYTEFNRYVQDLRISAETTVRETGSKGTGQDNLAERFVKAELSAPQISGNLFLFMFAGHEANANTLTFIIILLACHPSIQRAMQSDLDSIFGNSPADKWSFDTHHRPLMTSLVGAVINEALRLYTLIPVLPKCVPLDSQGIPIVVRGESHRLPPGLVALVNTSAMHRHPRYWPRRGDEEFDPYRWLHADITGRTHGGEQNETGFLVPPAGSFVPFSDGARGCLGQHFGLAELCAVVAVVFKQNSVRLLTSEDEANGFVDGSPELSDSWAEAKERAENALREGVEFDMSLRLVREVPVRFDQRV
ncbi:cytochrome P450 [Aspergillus steynii IBT 23096]|uniref:Cytochrome P450 n=1 Tax=Aspergillus steynii IBT 23096 TaxID=1392250 RepID=A0A2I2GEI7_9EURO|nr:cytochrome P450 [Aspergillus steynii IBT 23096]PLB51305.1 cytochrome P450 [Aspergillus steynii IBT 23096]